MTAALRLAGCGAALLLLSSCSASGPSGSGSTPSSSAASASVSASSSASPSPSASASPRAPASASPGASASTTATARQPLVVHIRNFAYVPVAPVVTVGQPIEIINDDAAAHTWSAAPKTGWAYTSGNLEKGQSATFPGLAKPGSYRFLCYYHAEMPSMNGVVTVRAAS